jgi:rare lipoprotein A
MQALFPRSSTLPTHVFSVWWRVKKWIVAAILLPAALGCGLVADAPHRPISMDPQVPPEVQTENLSIDLPQSGTSSSEIPSIAIIPSSPETREEPPRAKLAAPAPPIVETGVASWYGARHHGKRTASGELFDQKKFTAAHPTLPWGSIVKVTNLANGKSVEVRINDRGPYGRGRIIDLSRAAAKVLDMLRTGIAQVKIERLFPLESASGAVLHDK